MLSHSFWGPGIWAWLDWVPWLQVPHRLQSRCFPGLQSPQGLPGERPTPTLTCVVFDNICWQYSVPHWLLARGLPQFLATGIFPYSSSQHGSCLQRSKPARRAKEYVYQQAEVTCSHEWHPLTFALLCSLEASHEVQLHSGEGNTQGMHPRRWGHWGPPRSCQPHAARWWGSS